MKFLLNYNNKEEIDTSKVYPSPGIIFVADGVKNKYSWADYGKSAEYKINFDEQGI